MLIGIGGLAATVLDPINPRVTRGAWRHSKQATVALPGQRRSASERIRRCRQEIGQIRERFHRPPAKPPSMPALAWPPGGQWPTGPRIVLPADREPSAGAGH